VNPLIQIIQQALVDSLAPKKSALLQRGAIGASVIAVTVALLFIALLFLALAFYSWMVMYVIPPLAALTTAGAIMLICVTIMIALYLSFKSKPNNADQADETAQAISALATVAGEELGKTAEANPKTTLLVAGIAGLVAGKYLP
jgi:uncharacterized membrane protein